MKEIIASAAEYINISSVVEVIFLCNIAVLNVGKGKTEAGKNYGGVEGITVKNRNFVLKRLLKKAKYKNIIVSHGQKNMKIFENRLKKYCELSYETALSVLASVSRLTAEKYGIKIPMKEIYIIAPPELSRKIILNLGGISRLYTIVSDNTDREIADELYYSYGYVVRNVKDFENKISDESLIIRAGEKIPPGCVPVINFEKDYLSGPNIVNVGKIAVSDEKSEYITRLWGGRCGLMLYEISGMIPDINSRIDINKTADEIFLLDREAF